MGKYAVHLHDYTTPGGEIVEHPDDIALREGGWLVCEWVPIDPWDPTTPVRTASYPPQRVIEVRYG